MSTTLNLTDAVFTSNQARALELLASGVTVAQTAAAIGLTEARVTQFLSEDSFAAELASRRFKALAKHNARDDEYDAMEDTLIKQLKQAIPMLMQPERIVRVLQIINNAKRRGTSSPDAVTQKQTVIKLQLPVQIINRFSTNSLNQVVTVENASSKQSMLTVQSGQMKKLVAEHKEKDTIEAERLKNDPSSFINDTRPDKNFAKFGFD